MFALHITLSKICYISKNVFGIIKTVISIQLNSFSIEDEFVERTKKCTEKERQEQTKDMVGRENGKRKQNI